MTRLFDIPADASRKDAVVLVRKALAEAGFTSAALDARLLVAHALAIGMTALMAHDEAAIDATGAAAINDALMRRLTGESVARIIGQREFWGLPFHLSADTLEPRPDTETLIEAVLAAYPDRQAPLRFLDLGTGTGCILIALLSEYPLASGVGVDISAGALATATENAALNNVAGRAEFICSDWLAAVPGTFDAIVSNPPYIRSDVIDTLERDVRDHDPMRALDGGADGLDAYRRILEECPSALTGRGRIFFEIGFDQRAEIEMLAHHAGFADVAFRNDLGGHTRIAMLSCQRK